MSHFYGHDPRITFDIWATLDNSVMMMIMIMIMMIIIHKRDGLQFSIFYGL